MESFISFTPLFPVAFGYYFMQIIVESAHTAGFPAHTKNFSPSSRMKPPLKTLNGVM